MLIGQAALAFDIFFDAQAPRELDEQLRALLLAWPAAISFELDETRLQVAELQIALAARVAELEKARLTDVPREVRSEIYQCAALEKENAELKKKLEAAERLAAAKVAEAEMLAAEHREQQHEKLQGSGEALDRGGHGGAGEDRDRRDIGFDGGNALHARRFSRGTMDMKGRVLQRNRKSLAEAVSGNLITSKALAL